MKTIEDLALDYVNSTSITFPEEAVKKAFKKGVEFAQRWISIEGELPEDTQEILMKNVDWENEYYPEGVRSGWYNATHCKYYTSLWDDNKEEFVTSESIPTHWRPIELK